MASERGNGRAWRAFYLDAWSGIWNAIGIDGWMDLIAMIEELLRKSTCTMGVNIADLHSCSQQYPAGQSRGG